MLRLNPTRLPVPAMLCIGGLLVCLPRPAPCWASDRLPEASQVTRRMIERSRAMVEGDSKPQYTYRSRSVFEALNSQGKIIQSEERIYEVDLIAGFPIKQLVEVKGQNLTPEQLKAEQDREEAFRERLTSINTRKMVARKQSMVTAELLDRYRFEVKERVLRGGRPTLVMTFEAKNDPDAGGTIMDRVLNRLAGTLWVDEAEADTAKAQIKLVEPFTLGWFGILGSVTHCQLNLDRRRMPDGIWVNRRQLLEIHYRKLMATTHFRKTEESSGFKKVAQPEPGNATAMTQAP